MTGWKVRDIRELVWTQWSNRPDSWATRCVECQRLMLFTTIRVPIALTCYRCFTEYFKLEPGIYG